LRTHHRSFNVLAIFSWLTVHDVVCCVDDLLLSLSTSQFTSCTQLLQVTEKKKLNLLSRSLLISQWCITLYVVVRVIGVTVLDDIVYVVCYRSSRIRLYNTDTCSPLNVIRVDEMIDPHDIVVCRDDRQLYIAEYNCIWRVSVDDKSYVKWLTTEQFYCPSLSLTSRRLLVTSDRPPGLHQYNTTNRQQLRVVSLPQYISELYHGVETTRGTFVVGHRGTAEDKEQYAVSELLSFVNSISDCRLPVSTMNDGTIIILNTIS